MCICIFGHQQIQFSDKYKESTLSQILHNFRCWTTQIHHGEIEDNYKLLRFPDFGKLASRLVCPSLDFPRWSLPSPLVIPAWPDSRLGRTSHDVDGGGGGGLNVKEAKKLAALAEPIVWQLYLKDFLSQMKNLIWKLPCSPQQCDEDDELEIATTDFKPSHPLDGGQRCRSANRAMCTNFKECQHKYTEVHIAGIHNAWCSRKKSTKL